MELPRRGLSEENTRERQAKKKRNTCANATAKPYTGLRFFSALLSLYGNGDDALAVSACRDSLRCQRVCGLRRDPQPRYVGRTPRGAPRES